MRAGIQRWAGRGADTGIFAGIASRRRARSVGGRHCGRNRRAQCGLICSAHPTHTLAIFSHRVILGTNDAFG